jgi:hypothetical protein
MRTEGRAGWFFWRGVVYSALAVAAGLVVGPPVADAAFSSGDTVPFYVHGTGSGSRVDVRTDGTHDGSSWTVLFQRSLQTGDSVSDVQFVAGGSYDFQVATWNNSGGVSHDASDGGNIHTMTIPMAFGPLVFSGTPTIFSSLSGSYLASEMVEIEVVWADVTKNDQRKRWSFDGSTWSQSSDNEDRVAFIWDMQNDGFATTGTCQGMCHFPLMYTAAGTVDAWHWKATRTNPAGYADDKWWDNGNFGTESGRLSDPGQKPYVDNIDGDAPIFQAESDPGSNATFLVTVPDGMKEAVAWTDGAWQSGDVLPGYVMRRGAGSRVDVFTTATHNGTQWTVVFRRKLDTGDTEGDILFELGQVYDFQVTTWDNSGGVSHDTSEQTNIFTMTIPMTSDPLVFSGTPSILTSLSGELLSSEEIEITASWTDATRNDARKQWSFDGSAWAQSPDNEDRIAFIWDMQLDGFATTGTCQGMCHFPLMYTAAGTVDTWHWKATRTGPAGFTDDKWWDDGLGGTANGRIADLGTSPFFDNLNNGGVPSFGGVAGPGNSAPFLLDLAAAAGWSRSVLVPEPSENLLQVAALGVLLALGTRRRRVSVVRR